MVVSLPRSVKCLFKSKAQNAQISLQEAENLHDCLKFGSTDKEEIPRYKLSVCKFPMFCHCGYCYFCFLFLIITE